MLLETCLHLSFTRRHELHLFYRSLRDLLLILARLKIEHELGRQLPNNLIIVPIT